MSRSTSQSSLRQVRAARDSDLSTANFLIGRPSDPGDCTPSKASALGGWPGHLPAAMHRRVQFLCDLHPFAVGMAGDTLEMLAEVLEPQYPLF